MIVKYVIYVKNRTQPFITDNFNTVFFKNCDVTFFEFATTLGVINISATEVRCIVEQSEKSIEDYGLALDMY